MTKYWNTHSRALLRIILATGAALLSTSVISAAPVDYETVAVGNAGNATDPATGNLYGSVNYDYSIGRNLVTNTQYVQFLNAKAASDPYGLYNVNMGTSGHGGIERSGSDGSYTYASKAGFALLPVNYVDFGQMVRFANWMTNGQGNGSTESGAYDLSIPLTSVTRSAAVGTTYYIPSEDEWYKAAYYDPTLNGGAGGYWAYGTQSNTAPAAEIPPGGSNAANYGNQVGIMTAVGSYVDSSNYYGTFDQEGNLFERMDTIVDGVNRVRRSTSYTHNASTLGAQFRTADSVDTAVRQGGFRMTVVIPEASSTGLTLGMLTLAGVAMMRRRRALNAPGKGDNE